MRKALLLLALIFVLVLPTVATGQDGDTNSQWYDTLMPSEHYDSERTHRVPGGTFVGDMDGNNTVDMRVFEAMYPTVYNLVTRDDGELFLYGGAYGDHPSATGSYVARVDAATLTEVWRTQLINTIDTDEWNYPGVLGVLANGDLYVVYGYRIARLDAQTGEILQVQTLPTLAEPRDTAYNGFTAMADGVMVAKSVYRDGDCELQGFSAFLDCPNPENVPTSVMVAIDPNTLTILDEVEVAEISGGRITSTQYNDTNYIYLAGLENILRYIWDGDAIVLDDTWRYDNYLNEGQMGASALAVMNEWVVFQTNALPAQAPLSVVAISQDDAAVRYRIDPFADSTSPISFIPSMLSVDPENNRIYAQDTAAGQIAALDLDADNGLSVAWRVEQSTLHFTTLVGPADARILVGTDMPDFSLMSIGSGELPDENVVWRDAATGEELARSGDLPRMTSGVLVTPGYDGKFYYFGLDGEIFELTPQPASSAE